MSHSTEIKNTQAGRRQKKRRWLLPSGIEPPEFLLPSPRDFPNPEKPEVKIEAKRRNQALNITFSDPKALAMTAVSIPP